MQWYVIVVIISIYCVLWMLCYAAKYTIMLIFRPAKQINQLSSVHAAIKLTYSFCRASYFVSSHGELHIVSCAYTYAICLMDFTANV